MADGVHQEEPISLFYSYSHRDEAFRGELEAHLSFLRRSTVIAEWHDRMIGAGDDWKGVIDRNLASADIVLLLVSADFIASDYCWSEEFLKTLRRHEGGEARIIPVILRPCRWLSTPLAKLQAVPRDGKAVTDWLNRDAAFNEIAGFIERTIGDLRKQRRLAAETARKREEDEARRAAEERQRQELKRQREREKRQREQEEAQQQAEAEARRSAVEQQRKDLHRSHAFRDERDDSDRPAWIFKIAIAGGGLAAVVGLSSYWVQQWQPWKQSEQVQPAALLRDEVQKSADAAPLPAAAPTSELQKLTLDAEQSMRETKTEAAAAAMTVLPAPERVLSALEPVEQRLASAAPETQTKPSDSVAPAPTSPIMSNGRKLLKDCPVCPELVEIPKGTFAMGSPPTERGRYPDEGPQHQVTISRFAIGKTEVTFAEWDACVGAGGCNGYQPPDQGWGRGSRPVINVSWKDAQAYLSWLSQQTGKDYRLPTEAEWEYAARAGTTSRYSSGDELASGDAYQFEHKLGKTTEVAKSASNPWGLYDMHSNVWEWVQDVWHESYQGAPVDGSAWTNGAGGSSSRSRVVRGGSWYGAPEFGRSSYRGKNTPQDRNSLLGFRVARTLD